LSNLTTSPLGLFLLSDILIIEIINSFLC